MYSNKAIIQRTTHARTHKTTIQKPGKCYTVEGRILKVEILAVFSLTTIDSVLPNYLSAKLVGMVMCVSGLQYVIYQINSNVAPNFT